MKSNENTVQSRVQCIYNEKELLKVAIPQKPSRKIAGLFILAYSLMNFAPSIAAPGNPVTRIGGAAPGLNEILSAVLANNGQIQESLADVQIAREQLERARAAMWPKASARVMAAPLFEERGNAVEVTRDMSKWGPYVGSTIQIVQPLFTFGQIGGYKKAAEHQILANEGLAQMKKSEVLMTVKDFYYSYLMASDLEKLVKKLVSFLGEAIEEAEKSSQKKKKASVKPHDLYRLKTAHEDLRQKKLFATAAKQTAERAVLWMTGNVYDSVPTQALKAHKVELKSLDTYLALAKGNRPEFKALKAGVVARESLADAKQAQSYPSIFIGMFGEANWSPVRDPQRSFYALDPFNRIQGGAALGVNFDLEFARHSAEAAEERAQAMKLRATESWAIPGIEVQVKRAFWEVEQAVKSLQIAEDRKELGKKWFVSGAMGWSIGITPAKELMEALEGDGMAQRNYIETVYMHNLSLAKLSNAVGLEVAELAYGMPSVPQSDAETTPTGKTQGQIGE
jgi:outer membrane protein